MIKIRFNKILKEHRLTIQMIHQGTGINRRTLTELKYEDIKRVDIETLNRLCLYLNNFFPCTVNDILEFINE